VPANAQLEARIAELQIQTQGLDSLRQENLSLSKNLREVRSLQNAALGERALYSRLLALKNENAALDRHVAAEAARRRAALSSAADASAKTYAYSELDQVPSPVFQARPAYPADMRARGLGGQVLVDFVVDATGKAQGVHAASSTQTEFEQSAVDAVSQWQFKPGQKGGVAVNTQMQVPIVYTLENDSGTGQQAGSGTMEPAALSPTDWFSGGSVKLDSFSTAARKD
jgi:TonB family protein